MKSDRKRCLAAALMTLSLSACSNAGGQRAAGSATAMQLDEGAIPAPHALIRLQERPAFPVDENKRPFAMIDDRSDKPRAGDKALSIQEAKPR